MCNTAWQRHQLIFFSLASVAHLESTGIITPILDPNKISSMFDINQECPDESASSSGILRLAH